MRTLGIRPRSADDRGAILVIAILVVTVVALVTGFVLTRGEGSLRATIVLREVAGSTYAADGAGQTAINALRTGYTPTDLPPYGSGADWAFYNKITDGTGCFGIKNGAPLNELQLNQFYPEAGRQGKSSAAVVCEPEEGTGRQGSPVFIDENNKPGNAILTLGTSNAEIGLYSKTLNNDIPLRVQGGIVSNSTITADNGSIVSTESIHAVGACTPVAKMVAPDVDCVGADAGNDPEYDTEVVETGASFPVHRTPPTDCASLVTFEPGYYDDVIKLNNLTESNSCRNSVLWFQPGTYYFDFKNRTADPLFDSSLVPSNGGSNQNRWNIKYGTLIGGTRTGTSAIPGSCVNPIDTEGAEGVQFVFGGESQVQLSGGANMELCGSYSRLRPPIAFFGVGEGTATPTTLSGAGGLKATAVSTPGSFVVGAMPNALADPGGGNATWTNASGNRTTSMTMDGFAPSDAIPKGSILKSAELKLVHRESATAAAADASKVTITPTGSAALGPVNVPLRTASIGLDSIPLQSTLSAANWTALKRAVYNNGWSGAALKYDATIRGAGSAILDSVRLELTYVTPQFRAQTTAGLGTTNCLSVGGGCAVLSSPESYDGLVYLQGTTYAPVSRIDLALSNASQQVMRFGVIARSLSIKETGSFGYTGNVIEIPADGPGYGWNSTIVHLTVYLCPGQVACSSSTGKVAMKARVQLWDPSGEPNPPERRVRVLSWSHER